MGFPGGSDGKESACNAGDLGSIPGLGRSPGGGHGYPLQFSCLENPHGQRSLGGCSPWGHKESDTTELLTLSVEGREEEQKIIEVREADLLPQPGSKAPFNLEMNSEGRGCTSSEMRLNILLKHTFRFFFFSFLF